MSQRPLFLLSLPRAGSTLVQRVLAAHEEVSTAPEPWLLLPQVYAMRERGMFAEFGQASSARAIREFAENLPNGEEDYRAQLREFVLRLYARSSRGKGKYFLDKTPRYHLIVEDLFRLFPEAKFVFLWRNPLAVVASISETWGRGRWNVGKYRVDLFDGIATLVAAQRNHVEQSYAVRFEDLVSDPMTSWPALFDHLELDFHPSLLEAFSSVRLQARMGDRTGSREYPTLSTEPLDKWKHSLANPFRKRWCRSYLRWIGEERLELMGYDLGALLAALDDAPSSPRRLGSDLARSSLSLTAKTGRRAASALLRSRRLR